MSRAAALAAGLFLLASCGRSQAVSPPTILEGAAAWTLPDFALKDDAGREVRRADLLGRPWVAAFIYASCGSQCPMMTAKMVSLRRRFPQAFLVSFSVDAADTPERLASYKKTYGADWMFLTGPEGSVRGLCRDGFKLAVADGSDPKDPIIHSDKLVLVDRDGRVRGFFDPSEPSHLTALARALDSL